MSAIQGILNSAIGAMQSAWRAFTGWLSSSIAAAQSAVQSAAAYVSSTLTSMQGAAASAGQAISSAVTGAFDTVADAASDLWKWLTGGSVWTDMLDEMQAQTYAALGNIVRAFEDMSLAVPGTVPYTPLGPAPTAGHAAPTTSAPAALGTITLTIPVTVTLDGQVISRQVERRIVERVNFRGKKVA